MSLRHALPASIAALVLAACAAFSSADSPDDDGPAKDGEGGSADGDASSASTGGGSAAPDDDSAAPTSDGGMSGTFGNDAAGYVRCGDASPDCHTNSPSVGANLLRCCATATTAACTLGVGPLGAYCEDPITIACDGPEDCGSAHKCQPKFVTGGGEARIEYGCAEGKVERSACHGDSDCAGAGANLKCRKLTCGAVVLGVCANDATMWPDASPCALGD